jgi:TolB-like protein
MANSPNKLSQFWQELKRRNVVRVVTVYTGAAFVILSLVDMIREPFELPNWSFKLVIVILFVGLIIAVILSWIYDIHPERGMVKTEPADKTRPEEPLRTSKGWKIASYISFVVILGLIVLNVIPRTVKKEILNKSIAVLPLEYLSDNPDNEYLANGVLDAITGHLSLIEGLRVMPRTSVEQYREDKKTAKDIGEELDVSYLVEGSFQMVGHQVKLIIQLVIAEEGDHIFFKEYDREYKDILAVQSEVAKTIAREIGVAITPEQEQRIEHKPTSNLKALDLYQQANEEYWKYRLSGAYSESLDQAAFFYREALKHDPEFALAYAGLAMVYYSRYYNLSVSGGEYSLDYYNSASLDSMNILAEKALEYDDQLADAYFVKAIHAYELGNSKKGLELLHHVLDLNPNHSLALLGAAEISGSLSGFVNALAYMQKAKSLERGILLPEIYQNLILFHIFSSGLIEQANRNLEEYVSLTGDSIYYYLFKYVGEFQYGNQRNAFQYAEAAYRLDSTYDQVILYMGRANLDAERYRDAFTFYSKYYNQLEKEGKLDINDMNRMGHVLWMLGKEDSARFYFSQMIEHCKKHIEINSSGYGRNLAHFDLAGVYAFLGQKDSAYYHLEQMVDLTVIGAYIIDYLGYLDPLFESIRAEARFQELFRVLKVQFEAEQDRVIQWLDENDLL